MRCGALRPVAGRNPRRESTMKVHKCFTLTGPYGTTHSALCGAANVGTKGSGGMSLDKTNNWEKVTCKRCLKNKPTTTGA